MGCNPTLNVYNNQTVVGFLEGEMTERLWSEAEHIVGDIARVGVVFKIFSLKVNQNQAKT